MTRIAHVTDLHFGAADARIVAALLAELNGDPPDLVAISGDLTMGARNKEFRAARAFIDALAAPVLAVPGNHDISPYRLWQRFTDPYRRWREWIAAEPEPAWSDGRVAVIGLNTARRFGWGWDWSRGRVTHARLQRLRARLQQVPRDATRIVVAHHPLMPPEDSPRTHVAGGAAAALAMLADERVALVLSGHLHRGYARFASAAVGAPMILQGSTATSNRLRGEPNAYNRVTVGADGTINVEVRVWSGDRWTARPGVAGRREVELAAV
jgi:3',5'-cyclic AMP phosphodiesterase CpdA